MITLEEFTRLTAKRYLQSIVFVDDEIYGTGAGQPVEAPINLPVMKSPFTNDAPGDTQIAAASPVENPRYHPRQLVDSFAIEGMACALYQPNPGFAVDTDSELFRLCERADVVILDWDLFQRDGDNILPLIENLVDASQNTVPHHVRLCVIYSMRPDLVRVANMIYERLRHRNQGAAAVVLGTSTITAGATRITVFGKPDVVGRPLESRALEVREEHLAARVVDEFAKMHSGILPTYALHGLASIRKNAKRILDKFNTQMDGPFLLHRALVLSDEDAFDQLPELLAEEFLAVMLDDEVPMEDSTGIAVQVAKDIPLSGLTWPAISGKTPAQTLDIARRFLGGGASAIADDYQIGNKNKPPAPAGFHRAMGCEQTGADDCLAALFNLRTRYLNAEGPILGFGTIVRRLPEGEVTQFEYSVCLMPACDGMRLRLGATEFPFWRLMSIDKGANGRGIVVQTKEGKFARLRASGKPRDMLWLDEFDPRPSGLVTADENSNLFVGKKHTIEWVGQLKPAHAQRIAHDVGLAFSRVGVVEAEWLRLKVEGRDH